MQYAWRERLIVAGLAMAVLVAGFGCASKRGSAQKSAGSCDECCQAATFQATSHQAPPPRHPSY